MGESVASMTSEQNMGSAPLYVVSRTRTMRVRTGSMKPTSIASRTRLVARSVMPASKTYTISPPGATRDLKRSGSYHGPNLPSSCVCVVRAGKHLSSSSASRYANWPVSQPSTFQGHLSEIRTTSMRGEPTIRLYVLNQACETPSSVVRKFMFSAANKPVFTHKPNSSSVPKFSNWRPPSASMLLMWSLIVATSSYRSAVLELPPPDCEVSTNASRIM